MTHIIDLVDREEPLALLKRSLEGAISGQGRIVFLSGEAGIGKTRLVLELEAFAKGKDMLALHGRCLSPLGSDPYFPILEALREYSKGRPDGRVKPDVPISAVTGGAYVNRSERGAMPMGLLGIDNMFEKGGPGSNTDVSGRIERLWRVDVGRARDQMYETISSTLLGIARERPLLLLLDDLQWADSATLNLLAYIARDVRDYRVLIVCVYRIEEVLDVGGRPHLLKEAMQRIENEGVAEKVALEGLKRGETRQFLGRLLETEDIPEDLVEVIQERTSGNPYFIEELVKGLVEQGIIDPKDRRWTTRSRLKDLALPSSVKDVITRRLSKLDPRALKTLERAAVIGKEFGLDVLRAVSGTDEEELVDDLDLLVRSRALTEDLVKDREVFRFTSTALGDSVYEGISNVKRRMLHKRTAKAIEDLYGEGSSEAVYALAHHYTMANDPVNSVKYTVRAGDLAFRSLALEEAVRLYRSALNVLGKMEPTPENHVQKASILITKGMIHITVGELDTAQKELREALSITERAGNKKLSALGYFHIGKVFEQRSEIPASYENFQKAFELFKGSSDLVGQSMALQLIGLCHFRKGEYLKAQEALGRSGDLAEQAKETGEMASVWTLKAAVYSETGGFARGEECYVRAEELAKKAGDPYKMARIYNNWGDLRMREFRYGEAIPILEKSLEPGKRAGNLRIIGYAHANLGECYVQTGEGAKARSHIEMAKAIFEKVDEKLMVSRMIMVEGVVYRLAKDWGRSRERALKSISMAETIKIPFAIAEYLMEYGISCREEGAMGEARQVLERAAKIFKELGAGKFLERTEKELKAVPP
jgi:tetratricopeptide (TPR) repeat protein